MWRAITSLRVLRQRRISFAAIAMSAAWPPAPPEGWWIITRLLGSAKRLPFVPAASSTVLMLAAMPMQKVCTSHCRKFIVS